VAARGGRLIASRSREGGAQLVMLIPLGAPLGTLMTEPPPVTDVPARPVLREPMLS